MKWQGLALLLLVGFAAFAAPSRAEEEVEVEDDEDVEVVADSAFLLLRRHIEEDLPLEGRGTAVTIELYNAGTLPATNVRVEEADWPAGFAVEGETEFEVDSVPAGATVQLTYSVTPAVAQEYLHAPATATYTDADAGDKTSTSAPLYFKSYTVADNIKAKALKFGSLATFGTVTTAQNWINLAAVAVGSLAIYVGTKSYHSVAESNKTRRRQKALAELQKME